MTKRTIYLLSALGLVALIALNAIDFPGWPATASGVLKAVLIPAAWFLGSWYGRMDEQATWSRLLGEKVEEAMPTRVGWVNVNAPVQPASVMGIDRGCGDDRSVAALVKMSGAGRIEVVDAKDLDPLDAEKAAAAPNTLFMMGMTPQGLVGEGRHRVHKVPGPSQAEIEDAQRREDGFQADYLLRPDPIACAARAAGESEEDYIRRGIGLPPANQPPRACND